MHASFSLSLLLRWNSSRTREKTTMLKLKMSIFTPSTTCERTLNINQTDLLLLLSFNHMQILKCEKCARFPPEIEYMETLWREIIMIGKFSHFSSLSPESFHKHPMEIDLTQACVGELNTTIRGEINWPIIYGIGVNTRTGEIFPATFPDKGPDIHLRFASIAYILFSCR